MSYLAARFSSDEETCSSAEAVRSSCAEYSMAAAAPKRVAVCRGPNRDTHALSVALSLTPNTPLAQTSADTELLHSSARYTTIIAAGSKTHSKIYPLLSFPSISILSLFFSRCCCYALLCLPAMLLRYACVLQFALTERGNVRSLQHAKSSKIEPSCQQPNCEFRTLASCVCQDVGGREEASASVRTPWASHPFHPPDPCDQTLIS